MISIFDMALSMLKIPRIYFHRMFFTVSTISLYNISKKYFSWVFTERVAYYIILHYIILYCNILYYIAIYYDILYRQQFTPLDSVYFCVSVSESLNHSNSRFFVNTRTKHHGSFWNSVLLVLDLHIISKSCAHWACLLSHSTMHPL